MGKRSSQEKRIFLLLLFLLISIAACGPKNPSQTAVASKAAVAGSNDKPSGIGATPEPGNDGKPAPRSDGHGQSMVAANGSVYIGSDNGTLYAVNASNGTVRWQQALGSFVTVSAVMGGTVYVSTDGAVSAFDAASGVRRWQYSIGGQVDNPAMMFGNGTLFVSVSHGNNSHAIYALRATDGSQLWKYTTASITPVLGGVVNGVVYSKEVVGDVVNGDQHIVAIRASDGHVLWRMQIESTDGSAFSGPVEFNGLIYVTTSNGAIYAMRVATGTIVWHIAASIQDHRPAAGATPIAVAGGVIYVNTHQGILALQASNGALLWEKKSIFSPGPILLRPMVNNGRVYVVANGGTIFALRIRDGSQIWQFSKTPILEPLTVENGLIYVNGGAMLYALREQDGSLAWQQSVNHHNSFSSSDTSMLVAAGIVYASKDSGVVQTLHASDGKSLWSYAIQEQAVPTDLAYGASVKFASSISYQQALKIIADLGLQLGVFCPSMWSQQVNGNLFSYHSLGVVANVNSAPLWLNRLKATTGVLDTQVVGAHSCPIARVDDNSSRLPLQQSGAFVQVTFSSMVNYANALEDVSNLWFRMADPCYEQARARGTKPTWHSQGQADTFAKTHAFILATTGLNSIHWLDQLHAVAGVVKVDVPLKMTC